MSNKITNTKDTATKFIKVLVHGPAGSGKTRLCATTGGKPLIISAEAGLLSLRGQDIDVWEVKSMEDLAEVYSYLYERKDEGKYNWICLDSISEVAEVVLSAEKKKTKDPRQAYGEMQEKMMGLLRGFRDLPRNVYMSAKQEQKKDDITGGMIFGPSAPGTKIGPAMPYLFDLCFALHNWKDDQGNYQSALQTRRDAQYEAKDRSGALDAAEPPNLAHIYGKIVNPTTNQESK